MHNPQILKTEIGITRGATKAEIESKKFNIYIGISLGNKWFTKEHIKAYMAWALKNTKEKACILIADSLHAINYEIKENKSQESARAKALRKGDEIESMVKDLLACFPEKDRFVMLRWDDLMQDDTVKNNLQRITQEFEENPEFQNTIMDLVKQYLQNSWLSGNEAKVKALSRYVLTELPEHLNGIYINDRHYRCYVYPEDTKFSKFIEEIQKGETFEKLSKDVINIPKIFVELKVNNR